MNIETVTCYEKYLGLPAVISKSKKSVFETIKERVAKKVGGWRERFFFGRRKRSTDEVGSANNPSLHNGAV